VNTVVIIEGVAPVHGSGFFQVLHGEVEHTEGGLEMVGADNFAPEVSDAEELWGRATKPAAISAARTIKIKSILRTNLN